MREFSTWCVWVWVCVCQLQHVDPTTKFCSKSPFVRCGGVALSRFQLVVLVQCLQPEEQRHYILCTFKKQFHKLKCQQFLINVAIIILNHLIIFQGKKDLTLLNPNPFHRNHQHGPELGDFFFVFFFLNQDVCPSSIIIIVSKKPSLGRHKKVIQLI